MRTTTWARLKDALNLTSHTASHLQRVIEHQAPSQRDAAAVDRPQHANHNVGAKLGFISPHAPRSTPHSFAPAACS